MVTNWRQEARLTRSTTFTEGPAYQTQAEVRAKLRPFLHQEVSLKFGATSFRPARAAIGVFLVAFAFTGCVALFTRFNLNNGPIFDSASSASVTLNAGGTAPVRSSSAVSFSTVGLGLSPEATPTLKIPEKLSLLLKRASTIRYYPAPAGRFSGLTAAVAWYPDNTNRLWIIDPYKGEMEISLSELGGQNEPVLFYEDDPQAVLWSEKGVIVSYHLAGSKGNEWGLVVPQAGQVSASRLVQPATATVLAQVNISPLARP